MVPLLIIYLAIAGTSLAGAAGTWELLSPISEMPRQEHSVVSLSDTTIAIVGGIVPNANGTRFDTTSILQLYDIPSDTWHSAANVPTNVNHPNVAVVNGKIYLLGGLGVASDGSWRAFPDSWVYDPGSDTWAAVEPMPSGQERGSAAMGVYGNTIYLAGGMRTLEPIGPGGEQDTVDIVSAFDTNTQTWATVPENAGRIPEGRDHAGASVVDNKFYVLGGRFRGQYNVKDTVFILDLDNIEDGWTISDGRMPTARGGVSSGTIDGKVYIFGGEGNPAKGAEGVFNETEVFDTATETWKRLEPMRLPRHGGSAAAAGGGIYLPGGGLTEGASPVDILDVFRP